MLMARGRRASLSRCVCVCDQRQRTSRFLVGLHSKPTCVCRYSKMFRLCRMLHPALILAVRHVCRA